MRDLVNLAEFGLIRILGVMMTKTPMSPMIAVLGLAMSVFSLWLLRQGSPVERRAMIFLSIVSMAVRLI